jgi:hypothetical protein
MGTRQVVQGDRHGGWEVRGGESHATRREAEEEARQRLREREGTGELVVLDLYHRVALVERVRGRAPAAR